MDIIFANDSHEQVLSRAVDLFRSLYDKLGFINDGHLEKIFILMRESPTEAQNGYIKILKESCRYFSTSHNKYVLNLLATLKPNEMNIRIIELINEICYY